MRLARHYRDGNRLEPWRFFRACLFGFTLRDARRRAKPLGYRPRGKAYAERTGRAGEEPPAIVGLDGIE